jgi:23S rRNA pseudouridine1911/1915/1917 synthase
MPQTITVTVKESGDRIDALLSVSAENLSRSAAQRLLAAGCVTVNGKPCAKNYRVTAGDVIVLTVPDAEPAEPSAQAIPLDVIFEDADVIDINKPKGMVVHPAPGHSEDTLVNALLYHCGDSLSGIGGVKRPGIVHRIDKDTSGLLIAAKTDLAHASLSAQLKDHSLSRIYEAMVIGCPRERSGMVDAPIGRSMADRKKMCVTAKNSRPAVTHYQVIEQFSGYSRVRCRLETGRTHQIRVHLAYIGHPVLGDTVYGRKKPELGLEGQCLHAAELKFIHPRTGEPVNLRAELPEYFVKVLDRMK